MIRKIIAFFILVILLPLMIFISLIIFFNDGFPIIYRQKNYGKNHKQFSLYKFRTMLKNTPQMSTEDFNEANKYLLKSGRLLRKYSLDELPQLINIIEGKMKFIGPRPCMVDGEKELKILREKYKIDQLTPGITGWAQVNGRDLNTINKKVELDYYYKLNKSFLLDIKIILMTIFVVLFSRGIKH